MSLTLLDFLTCNYWILFYQNYLILNSHNY